MWYALDYELFLFVSRRHLSMVSAKVGHCLICLKHFDTEVYMFPAATVAADANQDFLRFTFFLSLVWSWWSCLTHLDIHLLDLLHSCKQVPSPPSTSQMFFCQPLLRTGLPSFSRLHTITELTDEGVFILFSLSLMLAYFTDAAAATLVFTIQNANELTTMKSRTFDLKLLYCFFI